MAKNNLKCFFRSYSLALLARGKRTKKSTITLELELTSTQHFGRYVLDTQTDTNGNFAKLLTMKPDLFIQDV